MIHYIFISVALLFIFATFVWLIQAHRKLKQEMLSLREFVETIKHDVAGLCSAAVSVDKQLANSNEQLMDVVEKVIDFEKNEHQSQSDSSYHSAIQKIQNGANAEELIKQCGINREEAALLIRLHGNK